HTHTQRGPAHTPHTQIHTHTHTHPHTTKHHTHTHTHTNQHTHRHRDTHTHHHTHNTNTPHTHTPIHTHTQTHTHTHQTSTSCAVRPQEHVAPEHCLTFSIQNNSCVYSTITGCPPSPTNTPTPRTPSTLLPTTTPRSL